jgi:hypothetical protein
VGPRAGLDDVENRKYLTLQQKFVFKEIIDWITKLYNFFALLLLAARLRHLKSQILDRNYCCCNILRLTVRRATLAQCIGLAA